MSTPAHELPPLMEGYEDEFGPIDPAVYQAAGKIWPRAVKFGEFALHDQDLVFNLMMKAVANVSRSISAGGKIVSLNSYLLRTFKRLVVDEREKTLPRSEPLSEAPEAVDDIIADLHRKILVKEVFARLDKRVRTAVQLWMLGYSHEEIAQMLDLSPTNVATLIHRSISRLKKTFADT